jgi:hypothetical protein
MTNSPNTFYTSGWPGFGGFHERSYDFSLPGAPLSSWNSHSFAATASTMGLHNNFDSSDVHSAEMLENPSVPYQLWPLDFTDVEM